MSKLPKTTADIKLNLDGDYVITNYHAPFLLFDTKDIEGTDYFCRDPVIIAIKGVKENFGPVFMYN
jgi:hypothetical protein